MNLCKHGVLLGSNYFLQYTVQIKILDICDNINNSIFVTRIWDGDVMFSGGLYNGSHSSNHRNIDYVWFKLWHLWYIVAEKYGKLEHTTVNFNNFLRLTI